MTFLTTAGLKTTLSVSCVKTSLTEDQVNTLMNTVISKNIFETNSGDLVKKSGT